MNEYSFFDILMGREIERERNDKCCIVWIKIDKDDDRRERGLLIKYLFYWLIDG